MTTAQTDASTRPRPLRLWPGVVAVTIQWLLWIGAPLVAPDAMLVAIFGAFTCGFVVVVWWAFFSRAPMLERWGAIVLMILGTVLAKQIVHESIATGMMGMLLVLHSVPLLSLALVLWAVATRKLAAGPRRVALLATVLVACGGWALVRTHGFTGDGNSDFAWRWSKTPEQLLLEQAGDEPATLHAAVPAAEIAAAPAPAVGVELPTADLPAPTAPEASATAPEELAATEALAQAAAEPAPAVAAPVSVAPVEPADLAEPAAWPGFRGPGRDGAVRGVRIATDWSASPPVELWRRPVGPGWSSFAVAGDRMYTQEQRGEEEVVACYDLATGEPLWRHADAARFWESNAGAGPRATPTLHQGRVYTLGATGIVNVLDADDGAVVWSRNAATDTGAELPGWGFAGSPLVIGDLVIVATAGQLVAYEAATGEPRWFGPEGGGGYSSPHRATIGGREQVLMMSNALGVSSLVPADGTVLWQHALPNGTRIVQPAVTADGDVLLPEGDGHDLHRVTVRNGSGGWTVEERWVTNGLKPYFNDFVVHEGHVYGFDGTMLASIGVDDGKRRWKDGRYGNGQLVLLPDQDLLLVLAEKGDLALAAARPDGFTELARVPAIEGKTWNHPVVAGDVLLVRNGEEMVAFRLPRAAG